MLAREVGEREEIVMRRFRDLEKSELLNYESGELFVHYSPRSFKKGFVIEFAHIGDGIYRVSTTGFSEPHSTEPFGTWKPTGDKCRYVDIEVDFPVFDIPRGMIWVVDEEKGILYEFLPNRHS